VEPIPSPLPGAEQAEKTTTAGENKKTTIPSGKRLATAATGENTESIPYAPCTATNLFYPCMKLVSRERVGAKYRKHYDKARPPFRRLLERDSGEVSEGSKAVILALKTKPICWNNRPTGTDESGY
jgi:hypothetical protein